MSRSFKDRMKTQKEIIKIGSLAILILLMLLTIALIPINIFFANFPEWVTVILNAVCLSGVVAYFIVFKTKLVSKIILPIVFGFFAVVCSFAPYLVPYWNSYAFKNYNGVVRNYNEVISHESAESDLKTLKYQLEKVHPMFKDGLTKEVNDAYLQASERLKRAANITVNDLRREIQSMLHPIGDAHTTTYNSYPNDKFLKAAQQKKCKGFRIASVNGKTTEQIIEDAKPFICYETEDGINVDLGSLASLDFYGFTAPFAFEWSNGEVSITEVYTESDFVNRTEYLEIYNRYFEDNGKTQDFVDYEIDEAKNLAVLTLTKCAYNQRYIDCVKEMFSEVKQKNIRNVAVDLRGNGGGSSLVGNEFIKYLPVGGYVDCPYDWRWGFFNFHSNGKTSNKHYNNLTFDGDVYILTDNESFSSAKDFAMLIQDNHLGKVIGEPSANSVNGYGEVASFYLRNTGLYVQISTKKWYRIDPNNSDDYVIPDYPCKGEEALKKLEEVIVKQRS